MTDTTSEAAGRRGEPGPVGNLGDYRLRKEPHHIWRMVIIWVVLSAVLDPLFYFLVGPHIPPGDMTSAAVENQFDFNVLFLIALPVMLAVWVFLGLLAHHLAGLAQGCRRAGRRSRRPAATSGCRWAGSSPPRVIVLGLFIFGTSSSSPTPEPVAAKGPTRSGPRPRRPSCPSRSSPSSGSSPTGTRPSAASRARQLMLPNDTTIAFHVTSLDVIHYFWAYQLSIKADANPQLDNIAYTTTRQTGSVTVRCDELCGLWHGAMYNYGQGGDQGRLLRLGQGHRAGHCGQHQEPAAVRLDLRPDANGADGGYYPDNVDPYSNAEVYGATPIEADLIGVMIEP